MAARIAVSLIEDDVDLRAVLARFLSGVGMEVTSFPDTADLDAHWQGAFPDVMVLDVNLPGENGFVAAARLRARSEVGIVMLTGRSEHCDRLLGLSIGVDHYLAKPVDLRELESVIRNLARRSSGAVAVSDGSRRAVVEDAWTLCTGSWRLLVPGGGGVDLSSAEYTLLLPLLEHPGTADSRSLINNRLGKPCLDADNRSLDVLVSRLRRKIENATGVAFPIRSARSSGYVFTGSAKVIAHQAS